VRREVHAEPDIEAVSGQWGPPHASSGNGNGAHSASVKAPSVLSVSQLYEMEFPPAEMLIEGMLPLRGASMIVGAAKSGKTILAVQMAVAIAKGTALFDYYRVLKQGAVMIIEHDDPSGAGSIKTILQRAGVTKNVPIYVVERMPFEFGPEFLAWLEEQIRSLSLRLVVLDSYTSLRGSRGKGIDIVKAEQSELGRLDDLAKRTGCASGLIHHGSKGSAGMDWSEKAAGTFAMSAATESQIHVSRFSDLEGKAPERLIRTRGRHSADLEMVLRFREDTLDYEHVLEGGASTFYPAVVQIRTGFGKEPFTPKNLTHQTGVAIATAHRQIGRLYQAGVLVKRGYGEYFLAEAYQ
jgi:hypothetical protein